MKKKKKTVVKYFYSYFAGLECILLQAYLYDRPLRECILWCPNLAWYRHLNLIQLYEKKNDRSIYKAISKETVAILNAVMDFF